MAVEMYVSSATSFEGRVLIRRLSGMPGSGLYVRAHNNGYIQLRDDSGATYGTYAWTPAVGWLALRIKVTPTNIKVYLSEVLIINADNTLAANNTEIGFAFIAPTTGIKWRNLQIDGIEESDTGGILASLI
jgi:hypothetical protein